MEFSLPENYDEWSRLCVRQAAMVDFLAFFARAIFFEGRFIFFSATIGLTVSGTESPVHFAYGLAGNRLEDISGKYKF